jgi:hypothetical protein
VFHLPQFINWRLEQRGDKKPAKVPFDPQTGERIDHLDSKWWMTYQEAAATCHPVGFVLTANDPYFLLDIDGGYDPVHGWNQESQDAARIFSGAGIEVSQSGTGLHIVGCFYGDASLLRNRWRGTHEFYTHGRFMALGQGFTGDVNLDVTDRVWSFVPRRPDPATTGIPLSGPVPEYTGPADNQTLLHMMLEARGSAAGLLGHHATFRQLWHGDTEALGRFYPTSTPGEPFDRSAADGALVMQLGFWTGKDAARVEELWRAAPLTQGRDKLDRDDYVARTMTTGLQKVRSVYSKPGKVAPVTAALSTDTDAPGGYMTLMEQAHHFIGCTYIIEDNAILNPDGMLLDRERFKVVYGGFEFQMQIDGTRPTKDAWECFTQNRTARYPKVNRRRFFPGVPYGQIVGKEINVLKIEQGERIPGDVSRFLDLLAKMLPDANDRAILLSWFASMVQNPGKKFQYALVIQGCEGNGKTFLLKCLEYSVGINMTHLPNPEDMNEKYNGYVEGRLLIGVEEIHMEGRRDMLDRLKKYITNNRIEIRGMRADKRMADNLTNWVFLTNYQDAVVKSKNDRRYSIFFTAQQDESHLKRDGMDGGYFPALWDWATKGGGYGAVADYLHNYQIPPHLDPAGAAHRAPNTTSTASAIQASMGPAEQILQDCIEQELLGFRGGWVSTGRARAALEKGRRTISHHAFAGVMRNLGYSLCDTWPKGRAPHIIPEEFGERPVLYVNESVRDKTFADYLKAQGYIKP